MRPCFKIQRQVERLASVVRPETEEDGSKNEVSTGNRGADGSIRPDYLSSSPRIYTVEGENPLLQVVSTYVPWCVCAAPQNKFNLKQNKARAMAHYCNFRIKMQAGEQPGLGKALFQNKTEFLLSLFLI